MAAIWTLGIETSGRAGSLALVRDEELVAEHHLAATGRRHARTLVPEMQSMLRNQGVRFGDLNVIAVSVGPGSFTGLRVGVVCAKALAYALPQARLIGIDTFLAVASAAPSELQHVAVIDDALRGELFAGEYVRIESTWQCQTEPKLIQFDEWADSLPAGVAVTGPGAAKRSDDIPIRCRILPPDCQCPEARYIALLGERACVEGRADDPWTLKPRYVRRSAAEEKRLSERG